ncbi:MAG: ADP-ribosylation factor-like protein [Candidatus Heimdallarchaeota archaeon]
MQRILLFGLNGAGKTSMYKKFFGKKTPEQLKKIPPTRGIAKYQHDFLRTDIEIIDTGGEKSHRQAYLNNPDITSNLCAVVYFLDVQDSKHYQEAANYLIMWTRTNADKLQGVKGYLLFNKIDPGSEGKLKNGLAKLAQLVAPLDSVFPGELVKTITSIYSDSSNEIFQRILLDALPKKAPKIIPVVIKQEPIATTTTTVTPPVVKESLLTQPVAVKDEPKETQTLPITIPKVVVPSVLDEEPKTTHTTPPHVKVTPPKIDMPSSPTSDAIAESQKMAQADANGIREKTAERLTDIIEASLYNNRAFVAIAVFSENVELLVGAVQDDGNPDILDSIKLTLTKINLEEYMNKIGKVRRGGEGHLKIGDFDIFFEKVSPEHLSCVICSQIEDDTIKSITELNKYLNQALSITPIGVDDDKFKRSDLMSELKMRLHNRGKSVDELL